MATVSFGISREEGQRLFECQGLVRETLGCTAVTVNFPMGTRVKLEFPGPTPPRVLDRFLEALW